MCGRHPDLDAYIFAFMYLVDDDDVVAGCVAMALYMVVLLLDDNGADDNVDDVIGATMQYVSRFCWC